MVHGIWLKFGLVGLYGGRIMSQKFQGKWDPLSCTCFTRPPSCIQTLGIYCGCLANQMVVEFGGDQSYGHMRWQKVSPAMGQGKWHSLHKAPICPHRQMNFSRGKIHLCYEMFLENLAIYGINDMWELFGDLWSNMNRGCFTNLK